MLPTDFVRGKKQGPSLSHGADFESGINFRRLYDYFDADRASPGSG
jgi:hypothetical protein